MIVWRSPYYDQIVWRQLESAFLCVDFGWRIFYFVGAFVTMIITFCGHSKFIKTPQMEEKLMCLLEERVGDIPAQFFLGGYGGFDDFSYQCCKQYQKNHPKTKLIFVTPYITAEYQKNHLSCAKDRYDEIVYPGIENKPKRFAILYRNKWMVDAADLVIAHIQYPYGGAYQTYRYAQKEGKSLFNLSEIHTP